MHMKKVDSAAYYITGMPVLPANCDSTGAIHPATLHDYRGFSLVELLVVIVIISALAAIAFPAFNAYVETAKAKRCAAEIRTLEKDIEAFVIDRGTIPASLADIGRNTLLDPWGRPYQFLNISLGGGTPLQDFIMQDLNTEFDLFSMGPDGASAQAYSDATSRDDIVRSGDGGFVGQRWP